MKLLQTTTALLLFALLLPLCFAVPVSAAGGTEDAFLTFSSPSSFTLETNNRQKNWDGTLQYSTDGVSWANWNGTTVLNSSVDGKLYLRGTGNTVISGQGSSTGDHRFVLTGSGISCTGNIETLLDYGTAASGGHPAMASSCFSGLFCDCGSLVEAPELSGTATASWCYDNMFRNCTGLTEAPDLPATVMETRCYNAMFYGCSSLTVVPDLPATNCYYNMFASCTALTRAPELPATTLASNCYGSMFQSCSSLTQAPELPATVLANGCYSNMFRNCASLTETPALPALTLVYDCYSFMFFGCSGLAKLPELPATVLANSCYSGMFMYCANIKLSDSQTDTYQQEYRIPSNGEGTFASGATAGSAFSMMLMGTGGPFTGSPEINRTYYLEGTEMISDYLTFSSPSAFTLETANGAKNWDGTIRYSPDGEIWAAWDGQAALSSSAEGKLYLCGTGNTVISGQGSGTGSCRFVLNGSDIACTGNIETLLDYGTVASGGHPAMADYCFSGLFCDCASLVEAPELPATTLTAWCYDNMFRNCTGLTEAPELPATEMKYRCYSAMFYGCTSLTTAPELPATSLADYCYFNLFASCTALTHACAELLCQYVPQLCQPDGSAGASGNDFGKRLLQQHVPKLRQPDGNPRAPG